MTEHRIEELRQIAAVHPKSEMLDECLDAIKQHRSVAYTALVELTTTRETGVASASIDRAIRDLRKLLDCPRGGR